MALFKKRKKDFIDLSEHYRKQQEKAANLKADLSEGNSPQNSHGSDTSAGGFFGSFFDNPSVGSNTETAQTQISEDTVNPEERRRRLARRLKEMTEKIEDLSNQIYHLQNRLEVLERKADVNRF